MASMGRKIAAGLIAFSLFAGTSVAFAQGDVIAQRKEDFKSNRANLGAIKKIVDDGADPSGALEPAKAMVAFGQKIPSLFPKGSDAGDTAAKPDIWTDWAGFEGAAKNFTDAAQKVADAAQAKDAAGLKTAFGALGGTCGACHNKFRK